MSTRCIVNVGVGGWYPKGSARLRESLKEVGEKSSQLIYVDRLPSGSPTHAQNMYTFKAYALKQAIETFSHRYVLWLDSSIYAVRDLAPVWERIEREGYYFVDNGFNLAQTASNRLLNGFGITRDEAEQMPEITTCCFGFDAQSDKGLALMGQFMRAAEQGLFNGSRVYDPNDSEDPRFLFCRHDQSALSLIADLLSMPPNGKYGELLAYRKDGYEIQESVCLVNWGHS